MSGASRPTSTITPSTKSATREERLRKIIRRVRPSGDSRGRGGLVTAESGVSPGIEQVREQAAESDHNAADDHSADDERIVARTDCVDHCVAHSGPGEDAFDEKRAGEKRREGKTNQGDDWQQRVSQRVLAENLALRQTLEARSADVIRREDVEKCGALITCDVW